MERTVVNKSSSWSPAASGKMSENHFSPLQGSVELDTQNKSSALTEMPSLNPKVAEGMAQGIRSALLNSNQSLSEPEEQETALHRTELGIVQRLSRTSQVPQDYFVHLNQAQITTTEPKEEQENFDREPVPEQTVSQYEAKLAHGLTYSQPSDEFVQRIRAKAQAQKTESETINNTPIRRFATANSAMTQASQSGSGSTQSRLQHWWESRQSKLFNEKQQQNIQTKLTIGQPGDKYEQEADKMAAQVMSMAEPGQNQSETNSQPPSIYRKIEPEKDNLEDIQPKIIQRQEPSSLSPVPNYQLTPPSLLPPANRTSHYRLGDNSHLHLDPQLQAMLMQQVQQQLTPATIGLALSQINLNLPTSGINSPRASNPLATPTLPAPSSPVPAGEGPAQPRPATAGDVIEAIVKVPAFKASLTSLQTQLSDRIIQDWHRLTTGEQIGVVSTAVIIGGGALAGILSDRQARQFTLNQLNGQIIPVPGIDGFRLEINTGDNNLMLGLHVDVGQFLPARLGFGPSSPQAIGGVPQSQPSPIQPMIQRMNGNRNLDSEETGSNLEHQLSVSKEGGSPLAKDVRSFMEPRFGADFSRVRVHTDSAAVQMNRQLNASAFTHGSDVYFGAGNSPGNNELTAHELTHVVQQTGRGKLNRDVQQEHSKPIQAKETASFPPTQNRVLANQFLEQEQVDFIQATPISDLSWETALNRKVELRSPKEEQEALQSKAFTDVSPSTVGNLLPTPVEQPNSIQAKELEFEAIPNKENYLQPGKQEEESIQTQEILNFTTKPNRDLQPKLEGEDEQDSPQAKELSGSTVAISSNKDLQSQSEEEQEPLQAKEISKLTSNLNREIQLKSLDISSSPLSLQRGIISSIKGLAEKGWDWVSSRVIEPLKRLASQGGSALKGFGTQIAEAYRQANPKMQDLFNPEHLLFRTVTNLRRNLFAKAIQEQNQQRAQDTSRNPDPNVSVNEPSQLEKLNGLMETFESGANRVFEIRTEIVEGAIIGDFNENPTMWNTIGQIAMGFVPYAGQAADVRDMIAAVNKLQKSGWKDGGAWFDLVLTGIGFVPGVGDIVKAAGRGAKGFLSKTLKGVLKNADNILGPVLKRAKGMLSTAQKYGKRFANWAKQLGPKLLDGVKGFAKRTTDFAKSVGQRAGQMMSALKNRISQSIRGAVDRAKGLMDRARGFLGQAVGNFLGKAKEVFGSVQQKLSGAVDSVKRLAQQGNEIASRVKRKIADVTRKAGDLLKESVQSAMKRGREAVQNAQRWGVQQFNKARDLGNSLVKGARQRATDLIRKGKKFAQEKVIDFLKQKWQGAKNRILSFLQDKWNKLKEKLGINKPGQAGQEAGERGARESSETAAKKAAELPQAIIEIKAFIETQDAMNVPVGVLIPNLTSIFKSKYSWIKRFNANPKGIVGHWKIYMTASPPTLLHNNYTDIITDIPSVKDGEFAQWFNSLSPDEFEKIWANSELREKIKARLRHPGGLHEWHLVSRANVFKRWGVTAEQIAELRTATNKVKFINPSGRHGGKGSTTAHNELLDIIDSSLNYETFRRRLQTWATYRLPNGVNDLPVGLRP